MSISGNELMWQALAKLDLTTLEASTEHGSDPNFKQNGLTPIEYLIQSATTENPTIVEMFSLLLGSGADINLKKLFGKQPLYIAVEKNFVKSAEIFLKYGADKDKKFSPIGAFGIALGMGITPLQLATKANRKEIIAMLQ